MTATRWLLCLLAGAMSAIAVPAAAQSCRDANCEGRVGYIFLPLSSPEGVAEDDRLFSAGDFPAVNQVVQLLRPTQLLVEPVVIHHRDEFGDPRARMVVQGADDFDNPDTPVGDVLAAGARVRILSYRTFVTNYGESGQLLFALVHVVGRMPATGRGER